MLSFARVSGPCEHAIYELNTETGTPIKRFRDEGNASDGGVACIKDEKFLAFYQNEGKLISRIGAAENHSRTVPLKMIQNVKNPPSSVSGPSPEGSNVFFTPFGP